MTIKTILIALLIFFLLFYSLYFCWYSFFFTLPAEKLEVFPPEQPKRGPGGKDYLAQGVEIFELRKNGETVFLFLPKGVDLNSQPVLLVFFQFTFDHWQRLTKNANLLHLAKKGNIVVVPVYQRSIWDPFDSQKLISKSYELTKEAFAKIRELAPQNDFSNFAILGISLGSAIATQIINTDLPSTQALILIVPTEGLPLISPRIYGVPFGDLKVLSYNSFLVGILAEKDHIVFQSRIEKLFKQAVPREKHLFKIPSDNYGSPPVISNHLSFFNQFNVLNFYGYLKIVDATLSCLFYNRDCAIAKGESEEAFSMGKWSDGRPINQIIKIFPK